MEKSYDNEELQARCRDFDENFKIVRERMAQAALQSGRRPEDIQLLAATKTVPCELIRHAVESGVTLIGENRAQELTEKYPHYGLNRDQIHFIGHLQTNKVAMLVGKVGMIQSVDSLKLAKEIAKRSTALALTTDVLVEVNVGAETGKSGVAPGSAAELIDAIRELPGIRVRGLMTIPPATDDASTARKFFSIIYQLSVDIRRKNIDNVSMDVLSMGMSGDYTQAILEGATMVRIGSLLFGKRIYTK